MIVGEREQREIDDDQMVWRPNHLSSPLTCDFSVPKIEPLVVGRRNQLFNSLGRERAFAI